MQKNEKDNMIDHKLERASIGNEEPMHQKGNKQDNEKALK